MTRLARLRRSGYGVLFGNIAARIGALGSAFVATLLLAREGGASVVGLYALLHVLPGLVGMIVSCGLSGAVAYFLAGSERENRRLPATIVVMAVVGGATGAVLWAAAMPLFGSMLFRDLSPAAATAAGLLVLTRVVTTTAKSCSQGADDLRGSNGVIFAEEFMFLPAWLLVAVAVEGAASESAVVVALIVADVATLALAWTRLIRRRFFRGARRPSKELARRIAGYGMRAQVGTVISQLNLRLDYVLLNAMAGPAVLGVYAVASKFAELIRVIGMALSYVLYPRFSREGRAKAAETARRLIRRAGLVAAGAAVPLLLTAGFVIPAVYGSSFRGAVIPAQIILLGLVFEGVTGVITAFLYGVGFPGRNSWAMFAGLVVTVVLDLLLIPPFAATGAAVASACAYLTTALALVVFFWTTTRAERETVVERPALARADAG